MNNLLRFLRIYQSLLLFLIIESFSIFLLIYNNSFQSHAAIKHTIQYTSILKDYSNSFIDYLELKEKNNHLANENAKLYSLINQKTYYNDSTKVYDKEFIYESAKVINNSINKRNNFITVNKGEKSGIKEGMGVVTNNGVIGIIHSTSKHYSIVISLLNRESALSIKIKRNNHNGILKWNGFDYKNVHVNNFPSHIKIQIGDTIVTNAHSLIFPEEINIGTVCEFKKDNDGYYKTKIKLFEDFNKLNFVYVVSSNDNIEQRILERKINHE